jgi:WD40 repeat protein
VAVSPDGQQILSASDDRTLRLWDLASERLLVTFTGHGGPVTSVVFSPDGRRVVSTSADKTVRVWGLPAPLVPAQVVQAPTKGGR